MKKVFAVIISVCLILSVGSLVASAATNTIGVADENVYANLFAISNGSAVESDAAVAVSRDDLAGFIDNNKTAYVAFAVFAREAGEYNFTLNFSGAQTASVKLGATVVTVNNATPFALNLAEGVNIVICFGATAEDGDAKITYTSLGFDGTLYEIEGEFYVGADANADGKVDILDLIRIKKHLANDAKISKLAADLNGDNIVNVDDVAVMRKCLLGVDGAKEKAVINYDLAFVNYDNEVPDNWEF